MDLERIGKFIADSRKVQNLTQKQLADKLGVNDKTISKWERGINAPDISLLIPLAKCLNVDVHEILNGKKKNKVLKKRNGLFLFLVIILLIVISVLSFSYDRYVDSKEIKLYSLESVNKDFDVKGFVAMNGSNYVISISRIDYVNKKSGNINEYKLKEIEIKVLNNKDVLYSEKKERDNNYNKNLYISDALKAINFIVEDDTGKININNLNLKILIHYKEINDQFTPISFKLMQKKVK